MGPAYKIEEGFTLVEVMVAMCILLFGMLALLNTAAVVISSNMTNVLRDEATSVAEESMSNFKNSPFVNLNPGQYGYSLQTAQGAALQRTFKGFTVNYAVTTTIAQPSPANPNTLTIQVDVTWLYKGQTNYLRIMTIVNNNT